MTVEYSSSSSSMIIFPKKSTSSRVMRSGRLCKQHNRRECGHGTMLRAPRARFAALWRWLPRPLSELANHFGIGHDLSGAAALDYSAEGRKRSAQHGMWALARARNWRRLPAIG